MLKINWDILHNNLDTLRKMVGVSKRDFSQLIGVSNAYRKDFNALGSKLLFGIRSHFPWVDEEWLRTHHSAEEIDTMLKTHQPAAMNAESTSLDRQAADIYDAAVSSDGEEELMVNREVLRKYPALKHLIIALTDGQMDIAKDMITRLDSVLDPQKGAARDQKRA